MRFFWTLLFGVFAIGCAHNASTTLSEAREVVATVCQHILRLHSEAPAGTYLLVANRTVTYRWSEADVQRATESGISKELLAELVVRHTSAGSTRIPEGSSRLTVRYSALRSPKPCSTSITTAVASAVGVVFTSCGEQAMAGALFASTCSSSVSAGRLTRRAGTISAPWRSQAAAFGCESWSSFSSLASLARSSSHGSRPRSTAATRRERWPT